MTDKNDETLIQEYLGGDLSPDERRRVEERLKTDNAFAAVARDYERIIGDLESIPEAEPADDLWRRKIRPAMEAQLTGNVTLKERITSFFSDVMLMTKKPAFAAVAFVVIIVVATIVINNQFISPESEKPYERALQRIQELRNDYLSELDVLVAEMEERKTDMSDEMRADYESTLNSIDEAIANAERFYALYSDDQDAIRLLMAAYDQKTRFLKQFIDISS